jgi:hypothetical protein
MPKNPDLLKNLSLEKNTYSSCSGINLSGCTNLESLSLNTIDFNNDPYYINNPLDFSNLSSLKSLVFQNSSYTRELNMDLTNSPNLTSLYVTSWQAPDVYINLVSLTISSLKITTIDLSYSANLTEINLPEFPAVTTTAGFKTLSLLGCTHLTDEYIFTNIVPKLPQRAGTTNSYKGTLSVSSGTLNTNTISACNAKNWNVNQI